MSPFRLAILKRAGKGLAALLLAALAGAIASPAFADFVGDHTLTAVIIGAGVPAILAAEKALQGWKP